MAPTEDTPVKPVKVAGPGETENENQLPGDELDDAEAARERSLKLGGGVPGVGIFGKYLTYLSEVRDELRLVTWPTRKMVVTETIVVIVITIFFTLLITGMDQVFAAIFNSLLFGKPLPWQQ